ncbi:MAG: putative bifunctional diguanylate cyclase/phosphodiesterase [Mycobacteriales bacterium]
MRVVGLSGQPSTRRLFATYALVSLVPVVLLAVLLTQLTTRDGKTTGLRQGKNEALLLARSSVAPLLMGHNLRAGLTASETATMRNHVSLIVRNGQVLRLRLRDLSGHVVFSDDGSGIGSVDDEALDAARGRSVTLLTWLNADSGDVGRRGPRVVEAYVPLDSAQLGQRIGVLEVYLPYAPIQAGIASSQRRLILGLAVGLFVLWLAMLAVSLSVTRVLRRQAHENAYLARHDALTGLPNRSQFAAEAEAALASASAHAPVVLAVIDLDRFKEVNDALGHGNGDDLLIAVAQRLVAQIADGCVVARLGGDEFGILLTGLRGPEPAVEVLSRLRAAVAAPLTIGGLPLAVEASIGFATSPADGTDVDTLLARADVAMYAAKSRHLGVLQYRPDLDQYDAAHLALVGELADAIASDQLVLHYQPKGDLRTNSVTALESLVRWQHPDKGLLYPDAFLPATEQTELIEPLTHWVLRTALADLERVDGAGDLAVAVNISARSLARPDFADEVLGLLSGSAVDPGRLILEITETALLADPERAVQTLERITEVGVRVSIDDFGAGQTSLGYLARLPVAELKIDKAFVLTMIESADNATIVRSVVELGHNLGFTVTAEGVETREMLAELAAMRCDLVQGYLLARPVPSTDVPDAIRRVAATLSDVVDGSESALHATRAIPTQSRPLERPVPSGGALGRFEV